MDYHLKMGQRNLKSNTEIWTSLEPEYHKCFIYLFAFKAVIIGYYILHYKEKKKGNSLIDGTCKQLGLVLKMKRARHLEKHIGKGNHLCLISTAKASCSWKSKYHKLTYKEADNAGQQP